MLSFNRSRINHHTTNLPPFSLSLSLFEGWWSGTGGGGASRGEEGGGAGAAHHQRARHGERRQWQVALEKVGPFIHSFIHSLVDCGVLLLQISIRSSANTQRKAFSLPLHLLTFSLLIFFLYLFFSVPFRLPLAATWRRATGSRGRRRRRTITPSCSCGARKRAASPPPCQDSTTSPSASSPTAPSLSRSVLASHRIASHRIASHRIASHACVLAPIEESKNESAWFSPSLQSHERYQRIIHSYPPSNPSRMHACMQFNQTT